MSEVLRSTREGAVLLVELHRPARHHAIDRALADALEAALDAAEADQEVAALVITGSGDKAFCAGQDMLEASGLEPAATSAAPAPTSSAQRAAARLERSPLPLIAAVNGYCYGGGALLAMACDIRLAASHATFRLPGAEYGLVVGAATLPRLVGPAKAKELIFTARVFAAAEALGCGFVNAVHAPEQLRDAALAMAHAIAANDARAVRESKRIIELAGQADVARAAEQAVNAELRGSAAQRARFRAATARVTGR
ncbi:MAG: enoyl-CoA hydratase/isomerase family protein [Gammaproteobacteria bacterium]